MGFKGVSSLGFNGVSHIIKRGYKLGFPL